MLNFIQKCGVLALNHIFFDKVWFHVTWYINAQNYHMWSTIKPHDYRELVGIWDALSQHKIIGPFFFNKTVNSAEYKPIITDFITILPDEERYGYLQQDGAQAYMSVKTIRIFLKTDSSPGNFGDYGHR